MPPNIYAIYAVREPRPSTLPKTPVRWDEVFEMRRRCHVGKRDERKVGFDELT